MVVVSSLLCPVEDSGSAGNDDEEEDITCKSVTWNVNGFPKERNCFAT